MKQGPRSTEISVARREAGLTQSEAADVLGVTERSWQRYESGERKMSAAMWELFQIKTAKMGKRK